MLFLILLPSRASQIYRLCFLKMAGMQTVTPKFFFRITSIRVYYFESHCVPTTLKSLYLDFASCVYQYNKLEINAPALEYLCFRDYI